MNMDARQIREELGRARSAYQKKETVRALTALITALRAALSLPGGLPSDIRSLLREVVQLVGKDELVLPHIADAPLAYQQGKERQLLSLLVTVHNEVVARMNAEDYETAAARKLRIDQALNQGVRSLEAKKLSEADEYFQQAIANYRDEHRVFYYIGKLLFDAGANKRALFYLRKGAEQAPEDAEMSTLMNVAAQAVRQAG
jgi:tetratricopeptide (TPR) repeat protein